MTSVRDFSVPAPAARTAGDAANDPGGTGARLRGDAARNLERIMAAAEDLLVSCGPQFTVEAVAERAGVGIGTVYRRFPTKDALIDAVIRPVFEQSLLIAESAAVASPAEEGLERYLWRVAEFHASHRLPVRRLWGAPAGRPQRERIQPVVARMLQAAQEGRRVRADVVYQDLVVLIWTITGLIDVTSDVAPAIWRRHLELLLDGMRPGHPPLATLAGQDWESVVAAGPAGTSP